MGAEASLRVRVYHVEYFSKYLLLYCSMEQDCCSTCLKLWYVQLVAGHSGLPNLASANQLPK